MNVICDSPPPPTVGRGSGGGARLTRRKDRARDDFHRGCPKRNGKLVGKERHTAPPTRTARPYGAPRRTCVARVEDMAPGQPLRSRHDADAGRGPALSQCSLEHLRLRERPAKISDIGKSARTQTFQPGILWGRLYLGRSAFHFGRRAASGSVSRDQPRPFLRTACGTLIPRRKER